MTAPKPVRFEGIHCRMLLMQPAPDVLFVTIAGNDVGEFGDAPFRELERRLQPPRPMELFIDGRDTRGASIDVSNEWALWLRKHRGSFRRMTMLTGSRFVQVTADFVRRIAELDEVMQLTTDPAAFDSELVAALRETPA